MRKPPRNDPVRPGDDKHALARAALENKRPREKIGAHAEVHEVNGRDQVLLAVEVIVNGRL